MCNKFNFSACAGECLLKDAVQIFQKGTCNHPGF